MLQEPIAEGQRVESFDLVIGDGDPASDDSGLARGDNGHKNQTVIFSGTTVGYQKFCRFPTVETDNLTLRITGSRWSPAVCSVKIY